MDPREMMKGMMGEGFNPMEMCRGMVGSITRSAEMATYATPELRTLFDEWLGQIEAEVLEYLKGKEAVAPDDVAGHFKLRTESREQEENTGNPATGALGRNIRREPGLLRRGGERVRTVRRRPLPA